MEYLMTYGWAILIIAVVLAVLFQLGVFSGGNFTPKAQAGSCQVSRTVAGVSLEGQCNGMLPQFVGQFNGQSSNVAVSNNNNQDITGALTVSVWVYVKSTASSYGGIVTKTTNYDSATTGYVIRTVQNQNDLQVWVGNGIAGTYPEMPITLNTWHSIIYTYASGSGGTAYVDGVAAGTLANIGAIDPTTNTLYIGKSYDNQYLDGMVADVQIYNASLSNSEVESLYLEGIGGAPVRPQNITAWYPLNGNANDYSGNNNNGQLNGVTFSSAWEGSYTAP